MNTDGRTHYVGCHIDHHDCARIRLERLRMFLEPIFTLFSENELEPGQVIPMDYHILKRLHDEYCEL